MDFQQIIDKRRSVRKFSDQRVPQEVVERITRAALSAPSARNTRSTHLVVVENRDVIVRIASMRDYGSVFMSAAPLVIVVVGDTSVDLWRENGAIVATTLQLSCVDEELATCWVHIHGRPRLKDAPEGDQAPDYLRAFLPMPEGCEPLCAIAIGYSDFTPAALPVFDPQSKISFVR